MKIIHTSDWHLGQHFFGQSRQKEHEKFLNWLIDAAISHGVDAIIVAGDIFDIGAPPSYARKLYNQFIVNLQSSSIQLIVLGGNHDSAATLSESKNLLACLNTTVIGHATPKIQQQMITIKDQSDQPKAIVCAIPFLRAKDIQLSFSGQTMQQKQNDLQQAIAKHYQDIFNLAQAKRTQLDQKIPIIATGHLATVGAKITESVRDIYIGTLSAFSVDYFPEADYIALGHIHRHQKVSGHQHIRYCGSPIALSFDENCQSKKVLLVEFKQDKLHHVDGIDVPCFQQLRKISGDLDEIEKQIKALSFSNNANHLWLSIEIKTHHYVGDLQQRIQQMIGDKPIEVLQLKKQQVQAHLSQHEETLDQLTVHDVFKKRLAEENWDTDEQKQMRSHIQNAFDEILNEMAEHENL